ncbi:Harbinger transposase-derived nuclease domain [Arabidopsis suecica]|uniref:Harbinger transposase-derived nuclease domain n=1 Tax=Arabidopsis suecica TaxID=45249 RepID=A0A8T1ZDK6_ARASU|nr:Harbinger transposase-derived nuclease domain [Arabidopsis suecica]
MFLRVCGHNEVQRDIGLRFGRNQETVNRKFGEVLRATELLAFNYIKMPTIQELRRIPQHLQADRRYWPFFSGFVGAMDGTHVCVKVKPGLQAMYWSRHDRTSFNVMAICDTNMLFTYVWNGAPGSCHDTRVLSLAQDGDPGFPLPPGDKYYVVDSGYPNKQCFLAPHRTDFWSMEEEVEDGRRSGGFLKMILDMVSVSGFEAVEEKHLESEAVATFTQDSRKSLSDNGRHVESQSSSDSGVVSIVEVGDVRCGDEIGSRENVW